MCSGPDNTLQVIYEEFAPLFLFKREAISVRRAEHGFWYVFEMEIVASRF
jgi:hypothetical protein